MKEAATSAPRVGYGFKCPIHALETQVFCFRAFDAKYEHLWLKYEVAVTMLNFIPGELEAVAAEVEKDTKAWQASLDLSQKGL